ncbi:hypothetical protein ABZX65_32990 [Streptomyces sp. NPDC003300]|uniref:hypothetical protein n=1 Tax=unclassified Streptomyces TaxID=2593676 RepID=UPI0033AFB6CB
MTSGDRVYPVDAALRPLLPGGLPAGTAVTTGGDSPLLLALAAGAVPWTAVGLRLAWLEELRRRIGALARETPKAKPRKRLDGTATPQRYPGYRHPHR